MEISSPRSYEYLLEWQKPTQEEIIRLCLCHTIFINFKVVCHKLKKNVYIPEAPTRCFIKKRLLLKILQYLQENTCVRVSFL